MSYVYNETQCVVVRTRPNEEKNCVFRVTLELETNSIGKAFNIRLTDDNDPVFLYSLTLNEEDFVVLKSQQGLRVDFDHFPEQFAKLLTDCKNSDRRIQLTLDDGDIDESFKTRAGCYLKVIESNDFKNLCHLSLRVAPGSNDDIKRHLCSKLSALQNVLTHKNDENETLKTKNRAAETNIEAKERKIFELESRIVQETSNVRLELSQQLAAERDKRECERIESEARHQRICESLQNEVALLTLRNNNLSDAKRDVETSLKEAILTNENSAKEYSRLQSRNSELQNAVSNQERKIESLEHHLMQLKGIEARQQHLQVALSQAQRDLQASETREVVASKKLNQCEMKLQQTWTQLQSSLRKFTAEKDESTLNKKKLEKMMGIVQILEARVDEIEKDRDEKLQLLKNLEESEKLLRGELEEAKANIETLKKLIEEKELVIKKKEDVTNFLNRKLNERDVTVNSRNVDNSSNLASTLSANKTLPPWVTNSFKTGESRNPILDPSYLLPVDDEERKKKEPKRTSAYFT